jgi:hypothetical protein
MTSNVPVPDADVVPDPKRPIKAYVSAALAAISTFVGFWIADVPPFTAKEIGQGIILGIIGSGLTGGATYVAKNPKVLKSSVARGARKTDLGYGGDLIGGVVLAILGLLLWLLTVGVLSTIGIILLVVGIILVVVALLRTHTTSRL